jgi:hypothetical protein
VAVLAAPVIWDTTAPRHLALASRYRLLVSVTGLLVARVVADPSDPGGQQLLAAAPDELSEIAAAERHFRFRYSRHRDGADSDRANALATLRSDPDLQVVDLTIDEQEDMDVLATPAAQRRLGLAMPLGRGERATLAVAANRDWTAGLDDAAARSVAEQWRVPVMTTQDFLRLAAADLTVTREEARQINRELLGGGFFGEAQLW